MQCKAPFLQRKTICRRISETEERAFDAESGATLMPRIPLSDDDDDDDGDDRDLVV